MPGPIPTGTSRTFGLYIGGVQYTHRVPADSVSITETAGDSNAVLEFDLEYPSFSASSANTTWMTVLGHDVRLEDLTNARRLFNGSLVNARRRHFGATGVTVHLTAISNDAWLDRRVLPSWTSKRPNGTNMDTDREMVQNVTTLASQGFWDAINTYVSSTKSGMPVVKVPQGGTARDILQAIAEAATTAADPTARRFYVDQQSHLHYFKGNEATAAPYILGDASYTGTVKATTGIVSLVSFREATGTVTDPYAVSTVTLNGGTTSGVTGLVPNEPQMKSITFNGTTGYASLAGASLHAVDGPWSVELWFKRGATLGTAQTLVSAGTNDYYIGFDTSNRIIVQKEGTGDNFVTTATYSDTSAHHLVVTRAVGTTTVYVDGAAKAGTTTARTFASAAGAVNIGRKLSTTNLFFTGTVQDFAFYSSTLSAATVLAHYNDGWTLVPDDFEFETEINNAVVRAYVRGASGAVSGFVDDGPYPYQANTMIDAPEVTSTSLRDAIGKGYIRREGRAIHGGTATLTMAASTWRAGQTVTIDNAALGLPDLVGPYTIPASFEIKQLNSYPNMGSGVVTYEIYFGALPWSGTFAVQRKKRRRNA